MRKALFSLLLAFILLTSLVPAGTMAAQGDSVRIVSVTPEKVARGSTAALSVTVEYTLQSRDHGILILFINTEKERSYKSYDKREIDRGSGSLVMTVSITAAEGWETELWVELDEAPLTDNAEALAEARFLLDSAVDVAAGSENRVMAEHGLELGSVYYCYQAGGREAAENPGVVGSFTLSYLVHGPRSVCRTWVPAPLSAMPGEAEAEELIAGLVERNKRESDGIAPTMYPFWGGSGSKPVPEEMIGRIRYLIVIGLDQDSNAVGYAVIRVKITDEDQKMEEVAPIRRDPLKTSPAVSRNADKCNYSLWASPITSYLYREGDMLIRAEWIGGRLIAEYYSLDFEYLGSRTVELYTDVRVKYTDAGEETNSLKLSGEDGKGLIWGGFYPGRNGNFVVVGWMNPEEDYKLEEMRVIKLHKDFSFSSDQHLLNCNTTIPFCYCSLRWAEAGDTLYAHTGHQMNTTDDGLRHQANMLLEIDTRDSFDCEGSYFAWHEIQANAYAHIGSVGFVGHSFNQFILTDAEGRLVMLDHGDGNPRAAVLQRFTRSVEGWFEADAFGKVMIQEFPGAIGDNTTGASLGGLAETGGSYITAYNYNGVGANSTGKVIGVATEDPNPTRNVYLSATGKNDFTTEGTRVTKLTDYPDGGALSAGTPVLVSTGMSGGYVLWEVLEKTDYGTYAPNGHISYAKYDAGGNVGPIATVTGRLSDCQPIFTDGKVIWYVTDNSEPVFYVLDRSGLTENGISMENGGEEGPGGELPDEQGGGDPGLPSEIGVTVGGIPVRWTDAVPFIDDNDRTMVPLRAVGDALGLTVSWDGKAREAGFSDGTKSLFFPIDSSEARTGDGRIVKMDTAAVIVNDRTYAPIRYLAEYFGFTVGWDSTTRTVLID